MPRSPLSIVETSQYVETLRQLKLFRQANRAVEALAAASNDAQFLTKASLRQAELEPGYASEGLIYFSSPQTLPSKASTSQNIQILLQKQ